MARTTTVTTAAAALRARLATASRSTTATALRARLAAAGRTATDAGQQAATAGRTAARRHPRVAAGLAATAATGALAVAVAAPWAAATTPAAHGPALDGTAALAAHGTPAGHRPSLQLAATRHAGSITGHPATPTGHHATATPAAARKASHKAAGPTTIYDSVTPSAIPAGQSAATYSDGPYQASAASVAGHGKTLRIDVNGSNPRADALDVEPGDATPAGAAAWVRAKLTADPRSTAIVYTFKSAWPATIASISALPASMTSHVKYWIADPTGTRHILPGAAATQWYWGTSYDITAAHPGFFS